jgi:hypothetical protein
MTRTVNYSPLLLRWIKRAARAGSSAEQIARRYHQEEKFVQDLCRLHGITITGVALSDQVPGRAPAAELSVISVRLANEALTKIEREAGRRGTTAPLLCAQLLDIIAADELFHATLDI